MSVQLFHSWRRPTKIAEEPDAAQPRIRMQLAATIADATQSVARELTLELASGLDVTAINRRALRGFAPVPGTPEAETPKRTHVDFHSPDFPWRYSPQGANNKGEMLPWLVLVVEPATSIVVAGGQVTILPTALTKYPLKESWKWAHVVAPDGEAGADSLTSGPQRFSRLISPHDELLPLTTYTAVLVPAFAATGAPSWDANGTLASGTALRVLYQWSFSTGEGGDFETLAALLHLQETGEIGKARLSFKAEGLHPEVEPVSIGPVDVRGALSSLAATTPDEDLQVTTANDLAEMVRGDAVYGPPEYGRPWVPEPGEHHEGWVSQLREDARVRIHAGTGQWIGVLSQDELVRAAVEQAGALPDAAALINRTAAAVLVAGQQWQNELPSDPAARLAVLAPVLSRMRDDTGRGLPQVLGGDDSVLDAALFSGAGQRLLGRASREGKGHAPAALLGALATSVDPEGPSDGLLELWAEEHPPDGADECMRVWYLLHDLADLVRALRTDWRRGADEAEVVATLSGRIDEALGQFRCEGILEQAAQLAHLPNAQSLTRALLLEDHPEALIYGPFQTALLMCVLECRSLTSHGRLTECAARIELLRIPAPRGQRGVDLRSLGDAVTAALDPRSPNAPAVTAVRDRIGGLVVGNLAPPRFSVELDFPTWSLVKRHAPEWFLPGAEQVEKHAVLALRTNPEFIDSFLVGLNSQFLSELRWRGMQVDRWGTPLQMFFAPTDPVDGSRKADIRPIDAWPDTSPLGSVEHLPTVGSSSAERLVVLIHSPIFRRYPRTLVYLQQKVPFHIVGRDLDDLALKEPPQLVPPPGADIPAWLAGRTQFAPIFTGSITPELVFFGFDVEPTSLEDYFLVLDEPPTEEIRFRTDRPFSKDTAATNAAYVLDPPTRVAIDGASLAARGGQ
ncbi:hypothetical protein SAMN06298212_11936 [Ruaniaceae bacterium KH17]|nr:hypothetical protein SAMN06298212_11936 [Ruaniaceae bacterium KH17]